MKLLSKPIVMIIVLVFLASIFICMASACTIPVPYTSNMLYPKHFAYSEGMNTEYTTRYENKVIDGNSSLHKMDTSTEDDSVVYTKLNGYSGLYKSPDKIDKPIDVFSSAKSDLSCAFTSSGLSNSTGSLCIGNNPELYNLLNTRGGNATN
jgi:hypothetical protein